MAEFPKKEQFLHPRLAGAFSRLVIKKLDAVDSEFDSARMHKESLERRAKAIGAAMKISKPYHGKLARMFENYEKNLQVVSERTKTSTDAVKIKKERGSRCEACKKRKKGDLLRLVHIVKSDAFKGPYAKYDEYKHHSANLLQLCEDCIGEVASGEVKKRKLNRLVKVMRKRNKKMVKQLGNDWKATRKAHKRLAKVDSKLKGNITAALSRSFGKV